MLRLQALLVEDEPSISNINEHNSVIPTVNQSKHSVQPVIPRFKKELALSQYGLLKESIKDNDLESCAMSIGTSPVVITNEPENIVQLPLHVYDHQNDNQHLKHDQCTQVVNSGFSPRKKKLSQQLHNKRKIIKRMKDKNSKLKKLTKKWNTTSSIALKHQLVDKGINEKSANFIARQIKLSLLRARNRQYHDEDKLLAFRIISKSRAAYKLIRQVLVLPSESTVRNFMKSKFQKAGLQKTIISALGERIRSKNNLFKKYVLVLDEMSIKPHLIHDSKNDTIIGFEDVGGILGRTQYVANQLLTLMIRSVCGKKKKCQSACISVEILFHPPC